MSKKFLYKLLTTFLLISINIFFINYLYNNCLIEICPITTFMFIVMFIGYIFHFSTIIYNMIYYNKDVKAINFNLNFFLIMNFFLLCVTIYLYILFLNCGTSSLFYYEKDFNIRLYKNNWSKAELIHIYHIFQIEVDLTIGNDMIKNLIDKCNTPEELKLKMLKIKKNQLIAESSYSYFDILYNYRTTIVCVLSLAISISLYIYCYRDASIFDHRMLLMEARWEYLKSEIITNQKFAIAADNLLVNKIKEICIDSIETINIQNYFNMHVLNKVSNPAQFLEISNKIEFKMAKILEHYSNPFSSPYR